jgi:surface antigen
MRTIHLIGAGIAAVVVLGACTTSGNTERDALGGAALGAAAGAIIGNNVGSGDAATGAAIGALAGGVGGAAVGQQQDRTERAQANNAPSTAANYGPHGEELVYDRRADRYYYVDRRDGRTYWTNGEYRG